METNISHIVLANHSSYNATIVTTAGYNLVESIAMCLILGGIIITTIIGKWLVTKKRLASETGY